MNTYRHTSPIPRPHHILALAVSCRSFQDLTSLGIAHSKHKLFSLQGALVVLPLAYGQEPAFRNIYTRSEPVIPQIESGFSGPQISQRNYSSLYLSHESVSIP